MAGRWSRRSPVAERWRRATIWRATWSRSTHPTQPAHLFGFDPNDRLASYAPPDLLPALSPKDTLYERDRDGLLLLANHPGKAVTNAYDLLGRLTQRVDAVTTTQTYDAAGRLATVGTSDGVLLTNGYDGTLLTQQAVSGPFSHAVNKTFDNFLRASSWNVDGTSPIALTYDADNLLTSAGGMTVTRSPNGLLTGTALGADHWFHLSSAPRGDVGLIVA